MNDRTIRVSKSSPSAMVLPTCAMLSRSPNMNDAMVAAKTRPADVTTEPEPAMARMMAVFSPW